MNHLSYKYLFFCHIIFFYETPILGKIPSFLETYLLTSTSAAKNYDDLRELGCFHKTSAC